MHRYPHLPPRTPHPDESLPRVPCFATGTCVYQSVARTPSASSTSHHVEDVEEQNVKKLSISASTIASFHHSLNGQASIKPPGNQLTISTRNSFHFRDFTPSTEPSHLPPLLAPLYLPLWTISRRRSHRSCPLRSSCAHHQSPPFTSLDPFAANYPPPLSSFQQLLLQALYHCRLCKAHCCKLCLAVTSVTPTMVSSASFLNPTLIHAPSFCQSSYSFAGAQPQMRATVMNHILHNPLLPTTPSEL